jgi:GTP-binding protein
MKVSALARTNIRELLLAAIERLAETPAIEEAEVPMPVYKPKDDPREFSIRREDNGDWRVSGAAIERAAKMTYWEHSGSLRRFQKLMEALGVEAALRKAGIQDGDTVVIGDFELEWQD